MKTKPSSAEPSVAIIGTVGVPAAYGGFETLADELLQYAQQKGVAYQFSVYCSGQKPAGITDYCGAQRRFIPIPANGISSIFYDIFSCLHAWWRGDKKLLILGVSGAPVLPFLRLFSRIKIVTNVDGVEWKREKWNRFAGLYLRIAEWLAVTFSHDVIADNEGIKDYLKETYGRNSSVITYGGDHALRGVATSLPVSVPETYAMSLCRIEPENNVSTILESFVHSTELPLVFVGNWDASPYGRELWQAYSDCDNITLLKPIYDENLLYTLRHKACLYIHGHSAGGTNPSLVEMMHFGIPVIAFDCIYNRHTTINRALYFTSQKQLRDLVDNVLSEDDKSDGQYAAKLGAEMASVAETAYVWSEIGERYLDLLEIDVTS